MSIAREQFRTAFGALRAAQKDYVPEGPQTYRLHKAWADHWDSYPRLIGMAARQAFSGYADPLNYSLGFRLGRYRQGKSIRM